MLTSRLALSLLIGTVCVFGASPATAQDYPTKLIKFVVPTTPGSTPDTMARIMLPEMSRFLGQPIIVENKPGADQVIALEHVAKSAPADGYTIVIVSVVGAALLPLLNKQLRFDPLKDLPPVISLGEGKTVLCSSSQLPWKTLNELVVHAKANPGKLNYGSSSPSLRFPMVAVLRDLGLEVTFIPYVGGAQYILAIARAEVQMGMLTAASAITLGEKIRILAATGEKRGAPFLDIPTFAELGHPKIRGLTFLLHVRAGTPKAVIDKLHAAASRALQQPDVKAVFTKITMEIINDTPEAAAKRLAEEAKLYAEVAKQVGIQPQ